MKKINLAIVGVTGLVGSMFLKLLNEKKIPINNLYCYASEKSEGKEIVFRRKKYKIESLSFENIKNKKIDFALFSAGGSISKIYAPIFVQNGAIVIDNSSFWRLDDKVPLVVPQVNFPTKIPKGIIANPNCSTIQCIAPLWVLHNQFGLQEVQFATYQAVSGSGIKGIEDFKRNIKGKDSLFYPYPIYNNCLPHIGKFVENGFSEEEMKMINETKKILNLPKLKIGATCVRVPIMNCHSVSVFAKFKSKIDIKLSKEKLGKYESIILVDDIDLNLYPMPIVANDTNNIFVGRIRADLFDKKVLHFFCVADNVRKGASANAVEILEKLI